jgi:DNA polymerase-3 subunit gamma/tau
MAIQLAEHCTVDGWEGDTLRLVLLPGGMSLSSERTQERLVKGLSEYYGKQVGIKLLEPGKARSSQPQQAPAERKAQERQERQRQAEREIQEDGYVQALQAGFDAQILGGSIRPID